MLYIFDKDDNFLNILSKETGLINTWFKDYQNHIPDEPFVFYVDNKSELLHLIVEENQVAFYDRDDDLRLMRMKEVYEVSSNEGYIVTVKCEPSFLELYDNFIEDRRLVDQTAQNALDSALKGSRYVGEVKVDLGNATDNFYWINSVDAIWKILETWKGGALKDTITLNEDNEIIERKIWILPRLGKDNGLIIESDYNAEQIQRKTLSYPVTALWAQGASLQIEDDDGNHTGGYTRYITFEDIEWKKSKGDPVDKPKGQKWVGDPQALEKYGYLHNGVRKHRFGHFSNQDYDDPAELLKATWESLQEKIHAEITHEATIDVKDKKVSLGDTATILDRNYNKPIELQSQITGLEYDILDMDKDVKIVVGKYIDMNENPMQQQLDNLESTINNNRPRWDQADKPISKNRYPDIKPDKPLNVTAVGAFQTIQLYWDYTDEIYVNYYEVYGSQISDFVPDDQHLLWRGKVSAFGHEVATDEKWYYYVRAVNFHGRGSDFSEKVEASTVRVISDDILFGSVLAEHLADNLNLANKLSEGTLDWINQSPLDDIRKTENRIMSDVNNRINGVLNDISSINTEIGELHFQDTQISNRIDGIQTTVQDTKATVNKLDNTVQHHTTQISQINQRSDGIEQSVIKVEGNLENAFTEISLIDQKANNISLSVSELETDINNLEISDRNLISNSNKKVTSTNYLVKEYFINEDFIPRETYTVVLKGQINEGQKFGLWQNVGSSRRGYFEYDSSTGLYHLTFISANTTSGNERRIRIYNYPSTTQERATIEWIKLVKGNVKITSWSPAPEDMADKANLISYINISTEGIRIHGSKNHISGQTLIDDGVIGTAAIANAAITRAKLGTAVVGTAQIEDAAITDAKIHSVNADKINATSLSSISANLGTIKAGILRSSNNNTNFNINTGRLHMERVDFTLGSGANIEFLDRNNRLFYTNKGIYAGIQFDHTLNSDGRPMIGIGVSDGRHSVNDSTFRGIRIHSLGAEGLGYGTNIISQEFGVYSLADLSGSGYVFRLHALDGRRAIYPRYTGRFSYDLGTSLNKWTDVHADNIRSKTIHLRNPVGTGGWRLDTQPESGSTVMTFRGINTSTWNYNIGASGYRINRIYLSNSPDVSSDERLKTDISNNLLGLDFINDVNTVNYRLNKLPCDVGNLKQNGVIAQQLLPVLVKHGVDVNDTMLVRLNDDGYYSVAYEQFIAPLIKSVQELDTKLTDNVEFLKLKVQYLEQKIKLLEEKIA